MLRRKCVLRVGVTWVNSNPLFPLPSSAHIYLFYLAFPCPQDASQNCLVANCSNYDPRVSCTRYDLPRFIENVCAFLSRCMLILWVVCCWHNKWMLWQWRKSSGVPTCCRKHVFGRHYCTLWHDLRSNPCLFRFVLVRKDRIIIWC
jgi:hypothetical protein